MNATLRLLREELSSLVRTIPGPVASMSLRVADCSLDVAWAHPEPSLGKTGEAPTPTSNAEPAHDGATEDPADEILAPLVGVFYAAPEPGAPPFVNVGDRVEAGQTVGIVEAMKLMNHVCAERAGEVVEVLVGNAEPVEFGQPLVRVKAEEG